MKAGLAYIGSFCLYWLGHGLSLLMHKADWLGNLYPVYNCLMCASVDVEDWGGISFMWYPPIKSE